MKKLLFLICFVALLPEVTLAEDKIIYVYRNDKDINAFYQEDIDSVSFSKLSVDSVLYDNYVTQEFYTSEGVTRIPLEVIDSVSIYQPQTVMKSDVFVLEGSRLNSIIGINGQDIIFNALADELPKVGQVLVTHADCEILETPFIGRISNVEKQGDRLVCHCTEASLDDIFEQVTLYGKTNSRKNQALSKSMLRAEASFTGNLYDISTSINIKDSLKQWTLSLVPDYKSDIEVILHKECGKPMIAKFRYSYNHSESMVLKFDAANCSYEKKWNIIDKKLPKIWFASFPFVWFTPRFKLDVQTEIGGFCRAEGYVKFGEKKMHELMYTDGNWTHSEKVDTIAEIKLSELTLGGKLEVSLCPDLNLGIYNSEYGFGIGGSIGLCLEGGYSYDENSSAEKIYSVLKDVQESLTIPASTNIHARHDLFGKEGMSDHIIKKYDTEMAFFRWYLLPEFHHVYLVDFADVNQYQASMKIKRDLIMPVDVGYLLKREIDNTSNAKEMKVTDVIPIWGSQKLEDASEVVHWFGSYWDENSVLYPGMMNRTSYNQPGEAVLCPIVRFPWMNESQYIICTPSSKTRFNGEQKYIYPGMS